MARDLYIGVYWGPRRESIDQCADRFLDCLDRLSRFSDVYASWYEQGKSRRDALERPIKPDDKTHVLRLLERGRHRRDTDNSIIEQLGFTKVIWNGGTDERAVTLTLGCGGYSRKVPNTCLLDLPNELRELDSKERLSEILRALVEAWEPDWGGVISHKSLDARGVKVGSMYIDWIFYINRTNVDKFMLPRSASAELVDGLGTIIATQDRPIDPTNPQDLKNIEMVEAALGLKNATVN
jgi:hypothetical protein